MENVIPDLSGTCWFLRWGYWVRRHFTTLRGPGANQRRKDEPVFRVETDPDPLPPVRAQGGALPIRASLRCMFALDEAPHLIELHLGHGQVPEEVCIDLCSLVRGSLEPRQHRFCRHTQDKGDPRQINLDQEHLESHHHLLCRGLQVKEDSIPRLGKRGAAFGALEDASLPTLRQRGRDRTDVPAVYHLSIRAIGMRARLAPGLGRSQGQSSG